MMANPPWLQALASIASLVTAVVAALAYGFYQIRRYKNRKRLEQCLTEYRYPNGAFQALPILHLAAELGLTETDVMDAAFRSKVIEHSASTAMYGAPPQILLNHRKMPKKIRAYNGHHVSPVFVPSVLRKIW